MIKLIRFIFVVITLSFISSPLTLHAFASFQHTSTALAPRAPELQPTAPTTNTPPHKEAGTEKTAWQKKSTYVKAKIISILLGAGATTVLCLAPSNGAAIGAATIYDTALVLQVLFDLRIYNKKMKHKWFRKFFDSTEAIAVLGAVILTGIWVDQGEPNYNASNLWSSDSSGLWLSATCITGISSACNFIQLLGFLGKYLKKNFN